MSSIALAPDSPISSGEIQVIDFDRVEDVGRRHSLLTEYLQLKGFDGLLLQDPTNFAWLTCGGDNTFQGRPQPLASILVTADARVVLCSNVDSGQIFDRELTGLGFLLKERPWTEDASVLRKDVCRGRRIASDVCLPGLECVANDLNSFRLEFTTRELQQWRQLGRDVAHAVEATARNFEPGATEAEVAGHLAHRLVKHRVEPVCLQVLADAQGWRYRHWSFGTERVERHCVISAIGRRHGLHVGVTRTVCINPPSEELQRVHHLSTIVQATGMFFSQHAWSMEDTWQRVARIYEKFDIPDEWRYADQADIIGFRASEIPFLPSSPVRFQKETAVFWHPSVRSARVGDTILIQEDGYEILTPMQNWPALTVSIKGAPIPLPGILIREEMDSSADDL